MEVSKEEDLLQLKIGDDNSLSQKTADFTADFCKDLDKAADLYSHSLKAQDKFCMELFDEFMKTKIDAALERLMQQEIASESSLTLFVHILATHETLSFDQVPTTITAKKFLAAVTAKAGLPVGISSNLIHRSKFIGASASLQSAGVLAGETLVLSCGPMLGGSQNKIELEDSFSSMRRLLEMTNS